MEEGRLPRLGLLIAQVSRRRGLPGGKRIYSQCRRHRFDPWVGKIPWRRKQQPTPVFLPGESHGQRSLAGYSPGTTEQLNNDPERDGCSWDPVTGLKIQTLKFGQRKSREPTCPCATDEERLVSSSQAPFHPSSHDD